MDGGGPRRTVGWRVAGRVQGVGFRFFVVEAARRAGVAGEVRNLEDGRVEILAQGTAEQLAALRAQVLRGPAAARVDRLESITAAGGEEEVEFRGFEIHP